MEERLGGRLLRVVGVDALKRLALRVLRMASMNRETQAIEAAIAAVRAARAATDAATDAVNAATAATVALRQGSPETFADEISLASTSALGSSIPVMPTCSDMPARRRRLFRGFRRTISMRRQF